MNINNLDMEYYKSLLRCNFNGVEKFEDDLIKNEFEIYSDAILNWDNYGEVSSLEHWWRGQGIGCQELYDKCLDIVKKLDCVNICEIGAGAGILAKYIYDLNTNINLTCIEGSKNHISHMKENFNSNNNIIKPFIDVNANIIKAIAQDIPLDNNLFDLVYTCTVLMHIPYLLLPKALMEITRISNKYVLHIENTNREINAIAMGKQKSELNKLCIDYSKMYELLNVKTIINKEYKYPGANCNFVCFLGEKIN